VADSFEFLDTGLPVDRVQAIHVAGNTTSAQVQRLQAMLTPYLMRTARNDAAGPSAITAAASPT
jgi:hypothetical protein